MKKKNECSSRFILGMYVSTKKEQVRGNLKIEGKDLTKKKKVG